MQVTHKKRLCFSSRSSVFLALTLLLLCLETAGGTEEDSRSVLSIKFWLDATTRLQSEGNNLDALRSATSCVRVDSSSSHCRTLAGSILAFAFDRDPYALIHFQRSAQAHPNLQTYTNLGLSYSRLYLNDLSGDAYNSALTFDTEKVTQNWGDTLFRMAEARQVVCSHWDSISNRSQTVLTTSEELIALGLRTITPFLAMSLPLPAEHILQITMSHARLAMRDALSERKEAEQAMGQRLPLPLPTGIDRRPLDLGSGVARRRLRIVYLAAHFSKSKFMNGFLQGVWQLHDRIRYEVFCVAWSGHHDTDTEADKEWIVKQVEHFLPAVGRTDLGVAMVVNDVQADVLVEMVGWYPEHRSSIVAHRPARLQVLYRFIGSGGGRGDDFYVSDTTSMPPELRGHVIEKIVYLQPLYLACSHAAAFKRTREELLQGRDAARRAVGLSIDGLYLGALNKYYKITPELMDAWAEILLRLPRSKLVFMTYRHYPEAVQHLRREASARGLAQDRLIFLPEGTHAYFLTVGAAMNMFLDTGHPISNGHTTVADMLWMGVPVVTYVGPAKPSRVAASLSISAGCSALVAQSLSEYVSLAVQAASRRTSHSSRGCSNIQIFDAHFFVSRWLRALEHAAQEPEFHHIVTP